MPSSFGCKSFEFNSFPEILTTVPPPKPEEHLDCVLTHVLELLVVVKEPSISAIQILANSDNQFQVAYPCVRKPPDLSPLSCLMLAIKWSLLGSEINTPLR